MTTQTPRRSWRRRVAAVAMTGLLAAPLAACGDEPEAAPTAAEQVPALATQLDRIDQALAGKRFEKARTLLERLTQQVIQARKAGTLDAAAADRILGAVSRLRAQLPEPKPEPVPTVTVQPPPAPDDDEDDGDDDQGKDKGKDAEKKAEEARKKAEEERRKQQEERQKEREKDDD